MFENKKTKISEDPIEAASTLRQGGIVVFPTETVYGIGADSRNHEACHRIYKIKNRPSDNPLIVHVAQVLEIHEIVELPESFEKLLDLFMPGPLTLVGKKKDQTTFSSGLATIAIRVPENSSAREMLQSFGGPVSAPSANLSGRPSITRFNDAVEEFSGKVDLILKGEEPKIGIESTVLDGTANPPRILRPGFYDLEDLKAIYPNLESADPQAFSEKPSSPGMKYRHYAPDCKVILSDTFPESKPMIGVIGIGIGALWEYSVNVKDNHEYMKELYSFFRDCDKKKLELAVCMHPSKAPGEEALLNRIRKASEGSGEN
ncbi:threonylcarbamoyl-AMP synthase [Leptospira perolatii]|uniref:Threonylcarbamoyl-AMP synthase n=1 Tax=Leptospira perolatii TaxID=2023191 RepID=A0A2M9ZJT2_9LEPT|nr:L-threonylcarbamoyladenylate synthase [Leptospira perolatii]PJZ69467.1 threonylcarbamoyl-AMP synthase [Leptospira perolatii]PJZ72292.1 threonylcarbamoyl-AMP synthase [Leptospira perolatii]